MSLSLTDLQNYLTATGGFPNVQINRLQDEPDSAIAVSVAGGTAPLLDGAFETATVHVRVRDTTDQLAEALALQLHQFISSHEGSVQMGSTYVLSFESTTGAPQYFDRDVTNRTTYMGTYSLIVAV